MDIKIGVGIRTIAFGMTEDEVQDILGTPNHRIKTELPNWITTVYNKLMMKCTFDQDDNSKLSNIEVGNPSAILLGQRVIGLTKEEIILLLQDNGYTKFEEEDYDSFITLSCPDISTEFQFVLNHLASIMFEPLWANENEQIWPARYEDEQMIDSGMEQILIANYGLNDVKEIGEIELGKGINDLYFGMNAAEIESVMGEPNKIIPKELDDVTVFEYYDTLLRVKIDKITDPVLYSIETHNPMTIMFGKHIFGLTMDEIKELLTLNGQQDPKYTDWESFETLWYETIQTTFTFCYNRLSEVEFSSFRDSNGEWIWPRVTPS